MSIIHICVHVNDKANSYFWWYVNFISVRLYPLSSQQLMWLSSWQENLIGKIEKWLTTHIKLLHHPPCVTFTKTKPVVMSEVKAKSSSACIIQAANILRFSSCKFWFEKYKGGWWDELTCWAGHWVCFKILFIIKFLLADLKFNPI